MTDKPTISDWGNDIYLASQRGELVNYLKSTSFEWNSHDPMGRNFVHYASMNDKNTDALVMLFNSGVDIHKVTINGYTAASFAAVWKSSRILEILCSMNASMLNRDDVFLHPLHISIQDGCHAAVYVLLSNGRRLKTCHNDNCYTINPEYVKFEQGVLRCRDVIVTLLGLKRFRKILPKLDRFLIRQELVTSIWSTRSCDNISWQMLK